MIENLKIVKKSNGKKSQHYGKYTYWLYQKLSEDYTASTYINSDIEIDKDKIIELLVLLRENGYKTDGNRWEIVG